MKPIAKPVIAPLHQVGKSAATRVVGSSRSRVLAREVPRFAVPTLDFALLYFVGAELGHHLSSSGARYVSFWPPAGFYLGALLLAERKHWPICILGAAIGNLAFDKFAGTSLPISVAFYFANTAQAVIAAWLVQRLIAIRPTLANLREFFGILLLGGGFCAAINATLGASTVVLGGLSSNFFLEWKVWWGGSAMATVLVTPLVLAWFSDPPSSMRWLKRRGSWLEMSVIAALIVFSVRHDGPGHELRLLPLLAWAGVRLGTRGATAIGLFVALALAFVSPQTAEFLGHSDERAIDRIFTTHIFLGTTTFVAVVPAIAIEQYARTLAQLRDAEERQRTFASAAFEGLCMTEGERVVDVNEQLLTMLGVDRAGIIGRELADLVTADSRPLIGELQRTGVQAPPSFPLSLFKPDGTLLVVEARPRNLPHAARSMRVIAMRDLTEQRKSDETHRELEAQLRQSQKLEAIGTLAGGIAHDLNNILMAIGGFTELAERAESLEKSRRSLSEVNRAVGRATELVKNILAFSRSRPPAEGDVDPGVVARETMTLLRSMLPSTVQVDVAVDDNLPRVRGNATQLQQVLINLCTNACHAMRDRHGRLLIGARAERPNDGGDEPELVHLSVTDDGEGMTEETKGRIFEPFFTTKAPGQGTGLGLSIVHGIVRDCGGKITVDSTLGKGTTIDVTLPVVRASHRGSAAAPNDATTATLAGLRVLFVDDERAICAYAEQVLARHGIHVTACESPATAWSVFRVSPGSFDVLLTDLTMPVMTGIELGRKFHELRPTLPVILMTGNVTTLGADALASTGIREVLLKPMTSRAMLDALIRSR